MAVRIGDVLLSDGLLSEKALSRALELQASTARGTKLGSILLKWDLLAEEDLLRTLAKLHRCAAVDWETLSRADRSLTRLLSNEQAARLGAVPYAWEGKKVRVAFSNPSNIAAVDEVQAITGRRVVPAVTTEVRLAQAQQRFYSRPVSRAVSVLIQKIDSRPPAPPAPPAPEAASEPTPAPAADNLWLRESSAGLDLTEIADTLLPIVDERMPPGEATEPGLRAGADSPETRGADAPDPLADDGPLSTFLEGAIGYYGASSDLERALSSIELGPVEDLDGSMEEPPAPRKPAEPAEPPESLDDTRPSRKVRGSRRSDSLVL
jgi:hypothetical protein